MAKRVIATIHCFDGATICISNEGDLYSFGLHDKLAHGHKETRVKSPKKVNSVQNIISLTCGMFNTMCLDNNGNVYAFGSNKNGQLALKLKKNIFGQLKTVKHSSEPNKIQELPPIKQISCGDGFNLFVSEERELYAVGLKFTNDSIPKKIDLLKNIDFVTCGGYHSICKTLDNEIYVWGENKIGQLGTGDCYNRSSPCKCTTWPCDIVDIKCGAFHTLVLTSSQEVYSCGRNYSGQLGRPADFLFSSTLKKIIDLNEIIRIECGWYHSICIDYHLNLFVFGDNSCGQLGIEDCDMYDFELPRPIKHPTLSNVIDVSSGGNHTFVKTLSNEIFAFGFNETKQLGVDTEHHKQYLPIQVFQGNEHIWQSNVSVNKCAKSARK